MSEPEVPDERARMLDRLLAGRDAPSVREQEALFARIESTIAPPKRPWRWLGWTASALAAVGAAVLLFVRLPASHPDDHLVPRGAPAASVRVRCVDAGNVAPCAAGAELAIEPIATDARPYVAAFSRRPDGMIVWYAPEPHGTTRPVSSEPLAFHLGVEHPPGTYRLFTVFSAAPMARAAIAEAMGEDLEGSPNISVVERPLEIVK